MTMKGLAKSIAGMFPKALGQIASSVVAGVCIAMATNWLLRTETPPPAAQAQPVFVVERVAPLAETALAAGAIRRPEMPLFLSVGSPPLPAPVVTAETPAVQPAHARAETEAIARLPQAQIPEMRREIEVAPLPPLPAEPVTAAHVQAVPAPASAPVDVASAARAQDPGFLGKHLPVAQRGIDLVQGETAAIVSVITSTLPFGTPQAKAGDDPAASQLY